MNKSLQEFFVDAWRWTCGLPPIESKKPITIAELRETEWSPLFEVLMRNRLIVGAFRYGRFNGPDELKLDVISDCVRRLRQYKEDGNLEHLVDVANLCMKEFVKGNHPKKHFNSRDHVCHVKRIE